jgi:hypothetical protein
VDLQQQQTRRGRAVLLWGLAFFLALQLGLTLAMESPLRALRDPSFGFKSARLHRRLKASAGEAPAGRKPRLVVMLGSSHVADALRGQLVEPDLSRRLGERVVVFNFGFLAENPVTELLNLERLLEDGVRPDLLLVEVMPAHLMERSQPQFENIPAQRIGLHERAVLQRHEISMSGMKRDTWLSWGVPWYAHRLEALSVVMPKLLPPVVRYDWGRKCDASGWVQPTHDLSEETRKKATTFALSAYSYTQDSRIGGAFVPAVHSLLQRCRDEHIPVGVVWMPESSEFRKLYSPRVRSEVESYLAGLSREYGATVVQTRDWVGDEHFFDAHHLLPEGAAVFTTRLGKEVIEPLLRP